MSKILEALKMIMTIIPFVQSIMQLVEKEYEGQAGQGSTKKQKVLDTIAALFQEDSELWDLMKRGVSGLINVLSVRLFNSTGKDPV